MEDSEPPSSLDKYFCDLKISDSDRTSVKGYMGLLQDYSPTTYNHSVNVLKTLMNLADFVNENRCNLDANGIRLPDDTKKLFFSGILHDMGKIRINRRILENFWASRDQFIDEVKGHSLEGFKILTGDREDLNLRCKGLKDHPFAGLVCLLHHEYQEDCYPKDLPDLSNHFSEKDVQLGFDYAALIALADSYDAAVNRNGHVSHYEGMEILKAQTKPNEKKLLDLIGDESERIFVKERELVLNLV